MKIHKLILGFCAALLAMTFAGCEDPDPVPTRDGNKMSAAEAYTNNESKTFYTGDIDNEAGTVWFNIPSAVRADVDITSILVRATFPTDAKVTPSLSGLKNLSEPYKITVTALNGAKRTYTLQARYVD